MGARRKKLPSVENSVKGSAGVGLAKKSLPSKDGAKKSRSFNKQGKTKLAFQNQAEKKAKVFGQGVKGAKSGRINIAPK